MDVVSIDIAKIINEKTQWHDGADFSWCKQPSDREIGLWGGFERSDYQTEIFEIEVPTFTLGFILRKLPVKIGPAYLKMLRSHDGKDAWSFYYATCTPQGVIQIDYGFGVGCAENPEDSAAKLALSLIDLKIIQ